MIGLTMMIGLAAALGRTIRVRRRELGVLRALGCRGSQLYATVCWQAVTVAAIGVGVGVPVGLIAGATLWRRFASGLGILPGPMLPWAWVGGVVVAAFAIAVLAALRPGRRAATEAPAVALREP
jgi:putative ABC transport system permease protein